MKNCRKVASLLNTYGVPSAPTMWLLISLQVPERVRRQLQMKSRTVLLNHVRDPKVLDLWFQKYQ
jgi:hypothetical protein